ncbi:MAG TPA: hypothetical protein VGK02_03920 [Candidatus Aquicultor sp.]|jgi:hypothetical protein
MIVFITYISSMAQKPVEQTGSTTIATTDITRKQPATTATQSETPTAHGALEASATAIGSSAETRARSKLDTIRLEGPLEELTLKLLDSRALGLSTYVPSDMVAESTSSAEGDRLSIYAKYAGQPDKSRAILVFARPKGVKATVQEMATQGVQFAQTDGLIVSERLATDAKRYTVPGADQQREFDLDRINGQQHIVGSLEIFNNGERTFEIRIQYPLEYKDGFPQRAHKVINNIIWLGQKGKNSVAPELISKANAAR